MKTWIRLPGLLAFFILVALGLACWYLMADTLVRSGLEKSATRLVGARVDIARADLTLRPAGITLEGIQVTDPEQPLINAVTMERIACTLGAFQLLRRRIIIEEMALEGLAFGTPRQSSGALKRPVRTTSAPKMRLSDKLALPALKTLDAASILAQADLTTVKMIESAQNDLRLQGERWRQRLSELPDKQKMEDYQARIARLKSSARGKAALTALPEITALYNDLQRDLTLLSQSQQAFGHDYASLMERVQQVARAPHEDARRLRQKYGLSPVGLGNIAAILFGQKIGRWVERCLSWHARLSPLFEHLQEERRGRRTTRPLRAAGVDVYFPEEPPQPGWLIHRAALTAKLTAGEFAGSFHDLTPDQDLHGLPFSWSFSARNLEHLQGMDLQGRFNRVDPRHPRDEVHLSLSGLKLENQPLGPGDLSLVLKGASLEVQLDALLSGGIIDAGLTATATGAAFSAPAVGEGPGLYQALSAALAGIERFTLTTRITGPPDDFSVQLSSDLDEALGHVVRGYIDQQGQRLQQELEGLIREKAADKLRAFETEQAALMVIKEELTARLNLAQELRGDNLFRVISKGVPRAF